jgi:hypothetical protein
MATELTKEEQHRNETTIYQCRTEAGLVALRYWLLDRQAYINRKWPSAPDDQVKVYQGEARTLEKLLKLIEQGPAINDATK